MLAQTAIFLIAAVVAVPLFRRFRLGAVLGYLFAGVVIGPHGLGFVENVGAVQDLAALGVVFLLFIIGLELQPSRLWVLRRSVFGLGSAQLLATGTVLALIGMAFGLTWKAAWVVGLALAMSSTAFVLQVLAERGELTTRYGRSSFAILLFQDLAVIPLLALIPLLSSRVNVPTGAQAWLAALKAVAVIAVVVIGGRHLLRPVLKAIAESRIQEIFTAAALLTVIGTSLLVSAVGLSMSLGAFLAGVLLADSEYRHELEADIEPFKGLLLGLFFISVGMSVDLGLLAAEPFGILGMAVALMAVKGAVLYAVGRSTRHTPEAAGGLACALSQGGEFAFVLFGLAVGDNVMSRTTADLLVIVVTLSMALTPLAMLVNDRLLRRWLGRAAQREFDAIEHDGARVIIAGFGRVGGIVGRLLRAKKIAFTALDVNPEQVELVRKFGAKAYYGDASRLDLLQAAGAAKAKVFVLAIDSVEASLKTAETVRRNFPQLRIYARARNRFHAYRLMDLGIESINRETFLSSLELAEGVLRGAGMAAWEAHDTVLKFKAHDERTLARQHAVYHDETRLIQTTKEAAKEMESLLESDTAADPGAPDRPAFTPEDVR